MVEPVPYQEVREYARTLELESREVQSEFPVDRLVAALDALSGPAAGALQPAPALRVVESATARYGAHAAGAYAKLLVSKLIEDYPSRARRIPLPESIRTEYPRTLARIACGLTVVAHASYVAPHEEVGLGSAGHADFWRDLRLAAQLSVPLTASRVLDTDVFLRHTFYRGMGPAEDLRFLWRVVTRLHGLGPVFRIHIDERDLSEFDDAGWERAYLRAAEMLRLYPNVKAAVGRSWTLDPQLDRVSPNLTYPRRQQMAHGAFLRLVGPEADATRRALLKSATRRRLYECGEYVPTVYTIVWPRRDMLRWSATRSRSSPS
jgi:hypothetical protein